MPAPAFKKRRLDPRKHAVEELTFDPTARAEYLTGFHKRKQQRIKHAQEIAQRKAKEQAIADRRALREQRRADLENHVQQVNDMLRAAAEGEGSGAKSEGEDGGEDEGWGGVEDDSDEGDKQVVRDGVEEDEVEYIDEDKYTTVTVGPMEMSDGEEDEDAAGETGANGTTTTDGKPKKRVWTHEKPKGIDKKRKPKKKPFRYEAPAERKATRSKQKARNSSAARERKGSKNGRGK